MGFIKPWVGIPTLLSALFSATFESLSQACNRLEGHKHQSNRTCNQRFNISFVARSDQALSVQQGVTNLRLDEGQLLSLLHFAVSRYSLDIGRVAWTLYQQAMQPEGVSLFKCV